VLFEQTGKRSAFGFTGKECVEPIGKVNRGLIFLLIAFIKPV
jgi:hypothetical protein